ncbi:hypothetical protein NBRGN_043_00830 [Nocardia brasiliensis NBRC 14402]|uniref:hypothetical protein n=1 Tax=Nocardia brasiliensis TaxID=37326 RepID=UPI0003091AF0|nr:hypothetical protein [Nocardia brasiliensis]GAJ81773.1 hypothetical protein NBRGN_043_00830 [Nocardia brasiliensis NBRC 14402]SUB11136.1 Uncharacterised protein [Nocardia brasiliensis]
MTGTVLDVDTADYYDTATKIAAGAAAWWSAIDARWPEMAKATDMAGSYTDGKEWSKSYDQRAEDILAMVTKVASAAHAYAIVLNNCRPTTEGSSSKCEKCRGSGVGRWRHNA